MAARRLITLMLVLLFLSSLAAVLAPRPPLEEDQPPPATERPEAPAPSSGALVHASLEADKRRAKPIRASVGDQLQLRVSGKRPATATIPALGASQGLGPLAPAELDLLLRDPGRYSVRILESGRVIGTIVVRDRPSEPGSTPELGGHERQRELTVAPDDPRGERRADPLGVHQALQLGDLGQRLAIDLDHQVLGP